MLKNIHLEIISPEERLCKENVTMVLLPGEMGEMGVLYGHEAMIVSLKPGRVVLFEEQTKLREFIVSSGSAEITGTVCTLLVDQAIECTNIDRRLMQEKLTAAEKELEQANGSVFMQGSIKNKIAFLTECLKSSDIN